MNTFERLSLLLNPRSIYKLNPSQIDSDVVKIAIDKGLKPGGSLYTNTEYLTKYFSSCPPEAIGAFASNIDFSLFPSKAVNNIMLAIQRFTDLNMEMAHQNDISPDGYSAEEYNEMVAKLNSSTESLSDPFDYVNFDQDLSDFYYNVPFQEIIQLKNDEERLYSKELGASCSAKVCDLMSSELDIRGKVSIKTDYSSVIIRLNDEEKYDFTDNITLSDEVEILPQTHFDVAKLCIDIGNYLFTC